METKQLIVAVRIASDEVVSLMIIHVALMSLIVFTTRSRFGPRASNTVPHHIIRMQPKVVIHHFPNFRNLLFTDGHI